MRLSGIETGGWWANFSAPRNANTPAHANRINTKRGLRFKSISLTATRKECSMFRIHSTCDLKGVPYLRIFFLTSPNQPIRYWLAD